MDMQQKIRQSLSSWNMYSSDKETKKQMSRISDKGKYKEKKESKVKISDRRWVYFRSEWSEGTKLSEVWRVMFQAERTGSSRNVQCEEINKLLACIRPLLHSRTKVLNSWCTSQTLCNSFCRPPKSISLVVGAKYTYFFQRLHHMFSQVWEPLY